MDPFIVYIVVAGLILCSGLFALGWFGDANERAVIIAFIALLWPPLLVIGVICGAFWLVIKAGWAARLALSSGEGGKP